MYNAAEISAYDHGTHTRRGPASITVKGALAVRYRGHGPPEEAELGLWIPSTSTPEAENAPTITAITTTSNGADTDAP